MIKVVLFLTLFGGVSLGQESNALTDEELSRLIRGHTVEGYSVGQLKAELAGDSADDLIDRMIESDVLRPVSMDIIGFMKRGVARERAILLALSDESNWPGGDVSSETVQRKAYGLAYPAVASELMQEESATGSDGLALCLMSPEGRRELFKILQAMFRIPGSDRTPGNPGVAKLREEARAIVSYYGTDAYLRGDRRKLTPARPSKDSSPSGSDRSSARGEAAGSRVNHADESQSDRKVSSLALIVSLGLLMVAFGLYAFRRKI